MQISRRDSIRLQTRDAGVPTAGHLLPSVAEAAKSSKPRSVIFLLQNHGLHSRACIPDAEGGSLATRRLPKSIAPLEKVKHQTHIIHGLHGVHASPSHSACFGALEGYRGTAGIAPNAATIDHVLKAHKDSGGSMKALITSLLASEAFLYRQVKTK